MQKRPSSQGVASATGCGEQRLRASSQVPVLHWSLALEQSVVPPPMQVPAAQVSPEVQNWPSSQAVPSGSGSPVHALAVSSQTPVRQEPPAAPQTRGCPPPQVPAVQTSPVVQ